ncbi:MAG: hypothetical protein RSD36_18690 [Terrisporobacter sp.]
MKKSDNLIESIYIYEVLITYSKDNIYSVKTILNNGGMFDSEDFHNKEKFQRYYIKL